MFARQRAFSAQDGASISRQKKNLQYWLMLGFSLFLGFGIAEGIVRVFAAVGGELGHRLAGYDISPASMPIEAYGEHGFRQKQNRSFHYKNGTTAHSNSRGYRGPLVELAKPSETYRVLLLGGSATHGFGVNDEETIDAHLRRILSEQYSGVQFEVVNLAYDGYDSYQLLLRLQSDGIRFNPDMIIINSGINDVRNARIPDLRLHDPRTNDWREVLQLLREESKSGVNLYRLAKRHSYLIRLPAFLLMTYEEQKTVKSRRAPITPNPQAIEIFEAHIREISHIASETRATLILSAAASSLESLYEPTDTSILSYWIVDAATTQQYRLALANRMQKVVAELKSAGAPAAYVSHQLAPAMFFDDCHLTSEGNRAVAMNFARIAAPFIELWSRDEVGRSQRAR
jgi:lysophospholipase L1-like esterase